MGITHIGCSGFHYKHWKGTFYPEKLPQTKWFSFYCEHFDTLELNVTFYRFPRLHDMQNWYNTSPANFRFAVKAPRAITQFKKFIGTERMLGDFYGTVQEGLKEKCGCCLFQMPPNFQYGTDKLDRIVNALDPSMKNVMEFRHESWWNEEVFRTFTAHNISFCGMSHPQLPSNVIHNSDLLYYRFHGNEQLYASKYSEDSLQAFVKELHGYKTLKETYVFFNNDINTNAIYNAKDLKMMIKKN
jgi:uncharacterized protein YecE (DUF72 family)